MTAEPAEVRSQDILTDLVLANRILAAQEIFDGWGHVSVRDPEDSTHFIMSAARAPALVRRRDLAPIRVRDGEPTTGARSYIERHIHAAIYRARQDVAAVVHCHTEALLPFGATGTSLRPLAHTDAFLIHGCPIWEIRDATDRDTMLVDTYDVGDSLAASLNAAPVVLMRGHGATIVGRSIKEVVYRAIYTRHAAVADLTSRPLGPIRYLARREAQTAADSIGRTLDRTWDLWSAGHALTPSLNGDTDD